MDKKLIPQGKKNKSAGFISAQLTPKMNDWWFVKSFSCAENNLCNDPNCLDVMKLKSN